MRLFSTALVTALCVMLALQGVRAGYPNMKDVHDALAVTSPSFLLTGDGEGVAAESVAESFLSSTSSSASSSAAIASVLKAAVTETTPTLSPTIAKWQAMSVLARQGANCSVARDQPPPTLSAALSTSATARAVADPASTINAFGEWVEFTWSVPAKQVLPTDRIALLWKPRCPLPKLNPLNGENMSAVVNEAYSTQGCGALYDRSPVTYAFVKDASPETWKAQGTGTFKFWLPKPQQYDLRASYVRASTEKLIWRYWLEVAGADVVARTPNTPTAARLSYGGGNDAPTVQVTWHTRDVVAGSKVSYGTAPHALTSSLAPTSDTSYYQSLFCASPARFQPAEAEAVPLLQPTSEGGAFLTGTINNAVLTGLLPDTTYFYEVTVPGEAETRTGTFKTAPATLATASPATVTRMLLIADGGQARLDGAYQPDGNIWPYQALRVPLAGTWGTNRYSLIQLGINALAAQAAQQAAETVFAGLEAEMAADAGRGEPYHGLLFNGDLNYARGEQMQWANWFSQGAKVFGNVPVLYTVGNHEASTTPTLAEAAFPAVDDGGECAQAYDRLLLQPKPSGQQFYWYSTTKGAAQFIQLDSEQSVEEVSTQRGWLLSTLAAVDRAKTPWLIVAVHRPLYSDVSTSSEVDKARNLTRALEPMFFENSVDLVLTGHIHIWQRSCPAAKGGCVAAGLQAPVHVATPSAGFKAPVALYETRPVWVANEGYGYGYSRMSYNATQLTYEVLELPPPSASNQKPTVVDTLSLSKPLGWAPPSPAAQSAFYASIAVTPEPTPPYTDTSTATLVYLLKCLLLPVATVQKFAALFVAPGSESWSGVYEQRTEWTPNQQWATTVSFLDVMRAMGPGFEQLEIYKYWRALTNPGGRCYFPDAGSGYGGIGPP